MQENRRTKITRRMLNEGLMELLRDKPLSRITVKEICETADVNRSTYYAHFQNPFDQIQRLEKELLADLEADMAKLPAQSSASREQIKALFLRTLDYIDQRRELFRAMYSPNTELDFEDDMLRVFSKRFHIREKLPYYSRNPQFLRFIFCAFGVSGLIHYWLLYAPPISVPEMAEYLTRLTMGETESFSFPAEK